MLNRDPNFVAHSEVTAFEERTAEKAPRPSPPEFSGNDSYGCIKMQAQLNYSYKGASPFVVTS